MATYVKDKAGAFKKTGDQSALPSKQRSEARMKAYTSATDARAWGNNITDNKQYIIDLMGTELPKNSQFGKYVPVDVLIKTIMGNKDADIKRLNAILKEVQVFIDGLTLNTEEKLKYDKLKSSWAGGDASNVNVNNRRRSGIPMSESKYGRTSSEARVRHPPTIHESSRTSSESRLPSPRIEPIPTSASESDSGKPERQHSYAARMHAPRSKTPVRHYSSALSNQSAPKQALADKQTEASIASTELGDVTAVKQYPAQSWSLDTYMSTEKQPTVDKKTGESIASSYASKTPVRRSSFAGSADTAIRQSNADKQTAASLCSSESIFPLHIESSHKDVQVGRSLALRESQTQTFMKPKEMVNKQQQVEVEEAPVKSIKSKSTSMKSRIPVPDATGDMKVKVTQTPVVSTHDIQTLANAIEEGDYVSTDVQVQKACSDCESMKRALDERNYRLQEAEQELVRIKKELSDKENIDDDIAQMAREIARLRASGCTDELKIVSTELQLLKKYCQKLIYIKADNKKLKLENDQLRCERLEQRSSAHSFQEFHSTVVAIGTNTSMRRADHLSDTDLRSKLQAKIMAHKEVSIQRDKLQSKIAKLEFKLKKYENLANEIDIFKERSKVLDSVLEEKLALERRLQRVSQMENEMIVLKMRADKADELQRALENAQNKLLQIQDQHCTNLASMQDNGVDVSGVMEELRFKTREAEVLRIDRDRMRIRLGELMHVENEYKMMLNKCRTLEAVRNERDIYKSKTLELTNMKDDYMSLREQVEQVNALAVERDAMIKKVCDLECVIADQESEISRLVLHIDRLSKGADHHQDKIKEILTELRSEIESKNTIINDSENQLANVQSQLKQTIDSLTKESNDLKQQICEANTTCSVLKVRLERLSGQLTETTIAYEKERKMCFRYKAETADLNKENLRLQEIADRMNDLTDAGKLESILKKSHAALQSAAEKLTQYEIAPIRSAVDSATNTRTSRQQVSSLITGIMNIPTHDYDQRSSVTMKGDSVSGSVRTRRDSGQSPSAGSLRSSSRKPSAESDPSRIMKDISSQEVAICADSPESLQRILDLEKRGMINLDNVTCVCKGVQAAVCVCGTKASKSAEVCICLESSEAQVGPSRKDLAPRKVQRRDGGEICADNMEDQKRLQDLEDEGYQWHAMGRDEDVTCICQGEPKDICTCRKTDRTPPCRKGLRGSTICVDNDYDLQRLEELEAQGVLSLEGITCFCRGVQAEICTCTGDASTETIPFPVPPSRRGSNMESDSSICVDSLTELHRLQTLEAQGLLSLTNIQCACKGTQSEVCECVESDTSVSGVSRRRTPSCRRGLYVNSSSICIDDDEELLRLQDLEIQGELSLTNIQCLCNGTQSEVCECKDAETSIPQKWTPPCRRGLHMDSSTICVDDDGEMRRLQDLERRGQLSLTNIQCMCNGTQSEICECKDAETSVRWIPPCRRGAHVVSNTICVDDYRELQRLQKLEARGKLSLTNVQCVCNETQVEVCKCIDAETSVPRRKTPPCLRGLHVDSNTICVDDDRELRRLESLEMRGQLSLTNIQCVCNGTQVEVCKCSDAETDMDICDCTDSETTVPKKNGPPCRRGIHADSNTICVDDARELRRLQDLERRGQLSLTNIQCVCNGTQVDVCQCTDTATDVPRMKAPPCRRGLDSSSICVDDERELQRLQDLENQGLLSLTNIQCVCNGTQSEVCECTDAATSVSKYWTPPSQRGLYVDSYTICVDDKAELERLQRLEDQGEQTEVCECTDDDSTIPKKSSTPCPQPCRRGLFVDSKTICVDNTDQLQRLQRLEEQGQLSLTKIKCVCKGTFTEVCDCTDDDDTNIPQKAPQPCRRGLFVDSKTICVDNADELQRLQMLEEQGQLSLTKIKCVCKGTSTEVCDCTDDDTNIPQKAPQPCRRGLFVDSKTICVDNADELQRLQRLEEQGQLSLTKVKCVCKGTFTEVCDCTDDDTNIPQKAPQPSRRGLFVDSKTIYVDNADDLQRLQRLEEKGQLSLTKIKCVCKGTFTEVCDCTDDDTNIHQKAPQPSSRGLFVDSKTIYVDNADELQRLQRLEEQGQLSLTKIKCVCKGTFTEVCDCTDDDTNISQKAPQPCRRGLLVDSKTICVDNADELQRLQRLEDQGQLTLTNITGIGKGTYSDVCERIDDDTNISKKASQPCRRGFVDSKTICVDNADELQRLQRLEEQGQLSLTKIKCVCKGTFTEVCDCTDDDTNIPQKAPQPCRRGLFVDSKTICVDNADELQRLQRLEEQGQLSLTKIKCVCKGTFTNVCECTDDDSNIPKTSSTPCPQQPCRRGSHVDADTICVDNVEDLQRLEAMELRGDISLTNITCVCKGVQNKICVCTRGYSDSGVMPFPKDSDPCDELRAELARREQELNDLKTQFNTLGMENQALRKHANELKEVAKSQISELSIELRKSRETDDSKTVADLQDQNKLLLKEIAMLKKLQCECSELYKEKLRQAGLGSGEVTPTVSKRVSSLTPTDSKQGSKRPSDMGSFLAGKSPSDHPSEAGESGLGAIQRTESKPISSERSSLDLEGIQRTAGSTPTSEQPPLGLEGIQRTESKPISSERSSLGLEGMQRTAGSTPTSEQPLSDLGAIQRTESKPISSERSSFGLEGTQRTEQPSQTESILSEDAATTMPKRQESVQSTETENVSAIDRSSQISIPYDTAFTEGKGAREIPSEILVSDQSSQTEQPIESKRPSEQFLPRLRESLKSSESKRMSEHPSEGPKRSSGLPSKIPSLVEAGKPTASKRPSVVRPSESTRPSEGDRISEHPSDISKIPELVKPTESKPLSEHPSEVEQRPKEEPVKVLEEKPIEKEKRDDDLKKQLEDLKQQLSDQSKIIPTRDSSNDPPRQDPDANFAKQLQDCTDELDALRKQLENCRKDLDTQKRPDTANDDLLKQLEDLKKQLADTKGDLEKERQTPKDDSSELDDLRKQLEALKKQLQDANKRLEDCESLLEEEKKKLEDERNKKPDAQKEPDDLKKQQSPEDKKADEPAKAVSEQPDTPKDKDADKESLPVAKDDGGPLPPAKEPVTDSKDTEEPPGAVKKPEPVADTKDAEEPVTPDKEPAKDEIHIEKLPTAAEEPATVPKETEGPPSDKEPLKDDKEPSKDDKEPIKDDKKPKDDKEPSKDDKDTARPVTPGKEAPTDAKHTEESPEPSKEPATKSAVGPTSEGPPAPGKEPTTLPKDAPVDKPSAVGPAAPDKGPTPVPKEDVGKSVPATVSKVEGPPTAAPGKEPASDAKPTEGTGARDVGPTPTAKDAEGPSKKEEGPLAPTKEAVGPAALADKEQPQPPEDGPAAQLPTSTEAKEIPTVPQEAKEGAEEIEEEPLTKSEVGPAMMAGGSPVDKSSQGPSEPRSLKDEIPTRDQSSIIDAYKKLLSASKQKIADQKQLLKESGHKLQELERELEKTKRQTIEAIKSARASYERDIMNMQDKYIEGIETLQASHEELISQGNAELEAEIESLRKDSVHKQGLIDDLRCLCFDKKRRKPALCQVQVQSMDIQMECVCDDMHFAYLLRKVLYCGLESLSFEDLQYMHTKICDATAKVMGTVKQGDYDFGPCSCDYRTRQTQAQTQVAKLQMEVALERQRLESLKKALDIERNTHAVMTQHFQRQAKMYMPTYGNHKIQTVRTFIPLLDNGLNESCRCSSVVDLNPKRRHHREPVQERQSSTRMQQY